MATGHNAAEVLEYALAVEVAGFALNWGGPIRPAAVPVSEPDAGDKATIDS